MVQNFANQAGTLSAELPAPASDAGVIETGHLEPAAEGLELPAEISGIVRDANDALDLDVVNAQFNPFLASPAGPGGKPLIGPYATPGSIFDAKVVVPLKAMAEKMGAAEPLLQSLLPLLSETIVFATPAHKFNVPGGIGNRVVFYGGDIGYGHIDQLAHAMRQQNMRLIKQMAHLNVKCAEPHVCGGDAEVKEVGAQGGRPDEIFKDGVGGTTHIGGLSAGHGADGKPISVKSDWPSNYGRLDDKHEHYNAHLFAIDYAQGVRDPVPAETLDAYCRNADMWDCCAGMLVPFVAEGELDPTFKDYMYNPLEIYDQKSARAVAAGLAKMDAQSFLVAFGSFYCAEGQYSVANLGPQEDAEGGTLLKKSRYASTAFGSLIDRYGEAYGALPVAERRKSPLTGWQHLRKLGPQNGGISEEQYKHLEDTDRLAIHLEWIPEHIKGWQSYRPKNAQALIARPMTVATLAWSLMRRYLPREGLARALAGEIERLAAMGPPVSDALKQFGVDPLAGSGKAALGQLSLDLAGKILAVAVRAPETRKSLLLRAGYNEIATDADKKKLDDAYDRFLAALADPKASTQRGLDDLLLETDKAIAATTVARRFFNKQADVDDLKRFNELTRELQRADALAAQGPSTWRDKDKQFMAEVPQKRAEYATVYERIYPVRTGTVMLYAAPASFGAWAQQPFLAETGCIRYVATAMHARQAAQKPAIVQQAAPGGAAGVVQAGTRSAGIAGRAEGEATASAGFPTGTVKAADAAGGSIWTIFGQSCVPKHASSAAFIWYTLMPKGTAQPLQIHAGQDKFVYVLDGRLDVTLDGKTSTAVAADLVSIGRGLPHALVNAGPGDVHCLCWVAPALQYRDLLKASDGIADSAELRRIASIHGVTFV